MNRQVLGNNKIRMDIRRRLYTAIVVNMALWGSESWAKDRAGEERSSYVRVARDVTSIESSKD
jgi:hypothetical protein